MRSAHYQQRAPLASLGGVEACLARWDAQILQGLRHIRLLAGDRRPREQAARIGAQPLAGRKNPELLLINAERPHRVDRLARL